MRRLSAPAYGMTDARSRPVNRLVLERLNAAPVTVRGPWKHYRCFACADPSAHLGINEEIGLAHCLRCGLTVQLPSATRQPFSRPSSTNKHKAQIIKDDLDLAKRISQCFSHTPDRSVIEFMRRRGFPTENAIELYQFGKGRFQNCAAFPCRGSHGSVNYVQFREALAGKNRYCSLTGIKPRLDHSPTLLWGAARETLLLVEGPIDAAAMRISLPSLWTAPNYGTGVKRTIIDDIAACADLTTILIWFDNEPQATTAAMRMRHVLLCHCNASVSTLTWPPRCQYKDQNEAGPLAAQFLLGLLHGYAVKNRTVSTA